MLLHRGFHDDNCPAVTTALSLAPSRAPCGRERERFRGIKNQHRAPNRPERAASRVSVGGEQPRRATPRAYPLAPRAHSF